MPRFHLRTFHLVVVGCLVLAWRWWAVERIAGPVRQLEKMDVSVGFDSPLAGSPANNYWRRFAMGHQFEDLPHWVSINYYDAEWMPPFDDSVVVAAAEQISKLSTVDEMRLDAPGITAASLPAVARLRRLCHLTLGDVAIGDADIPALAQLTQLETLKIEGTTLTDAGIQQLRAKLPKCEVVRHQPWLPLLEAIEQPQPES